MRAGDKDPGSLLNTAQRESDNSRPKSKNEHGAPRGKNLGGEEKRLINGRILQGTAISEAKERSGPVATFLGNGRREGSFGDYGL